MLKVKVKDWPGCILPESNDLSSAVTVWAVVSLLVHLTVVPALTVSVSGLNAKFAIFTSVPEADEADDAGAVAAGAVVDPLVGMAIVAAGVGLEPVTGMAGEHADRIAMDAIAKRTNKTFFITTSHPPYSGPPGSIQTYLLRATLPLRLPERPAPEILLNIDRFNPGYVCAFRLD